MREETTIEKGRFITFEGIDGAGKSTHLNWVAEQIKARGREVLLTREPGGTPLGEKLRTLLLAESMHPETEALLMFAARKEHLTQVIVPALERGSWVISDRFTDASFAYQGGGRGIDTAKLESLEAWVQGGLQPDLTLLFDLPVETGRQRLLAGRAGSGIGNDQGLDKFEQERGEFFERVRHAYRARAQKYPGRIRVVDASRSIIDIQKSLEKIILTIL